MRRVPAPANRAVRVLLNELIRCSKHPPQGMRRHLGAACPSILQAADHMAQAVATGQVSSLTWAAPGGSEDVLNLLLLSFSSLHRGIAPAGGTGRQDTAVAAAAATAAAEWTLTDANGITALLSVIAACLSALHDSLVHTIAAEGSAGGGAATAEAHRALAAIAQERPCRDLVAVVWPENLSGKGTPAATASLLQSAAVNLLKLAGVCPPLAAALLPELRTEAFIAHVCSGLMAGLEVPPWAARATSNLGDLLQIFMQAAVAGDEAKAPLAQLVLGCPQAGALALAALKVPSLSPALPGLAGLLHDAVFLMQWRLLCLVVQDGRRLAGTNPHTSMAVVPPFELTAEHVRDVVHATTNHPKVAQLAAEVLPLMWERLPASQRSRALMPIAVFARRVLDATLLHLNASAACQTVASGRPDAAAAAGCSMTAAGGGDMPAVAGKRARKMSARSTSSSGTAALASLREAVAAPGQDTLLLATEAMRLLNRCLVPQEEETAFAWEAIKPRALLVLRGKLCCSLEALLRAAGGGSPSQVVNLVHPTSSLTVTVAALLSGDPQAPTAVADTLSMVTTLRKLLTHQVRSARGAVFAPASPSGTAAGQPAARASAPSAAADAATGVLNSVLHCGPLLTLLESGDGAAVGLAISMLIQILPLAVRAHITAQCAYENNSGWLKEGRRLLAIIAATNAQGLGWLTAAAGGPRVMQVMLKAAGAPGDWAPAEGSGGLSDTQVHGLEVGALCITALAAAVDDSTWLAESRRLDLSRRAAEWLGVKVTDGVVQQEPSESGLYGRHMVMAQSLRTNMSAYAPGLLKALSPGMDDSMLARALMRSAAHMSYNQQLCRTESEGTTTPLTSGSVLHAFILNEAIQQQERAVLELDDLQPAVLVGCWHQRCTNLDGDSEAVLKTYTCGGCMLARYCSKECQRDAWRGGHRAACNARQLTHPPTRQRPAEGEQPHPHEQGSAAVAAAQPVCTTSVPGTPDSAAGGAAFTAAAAAGSADTAAPTAAGAAAERKALLVTAVQVAKSQAVEAAAAAAMAAAALAAATAAADVADAQSAAAACSLDQLRAQLASMD